MLDRVAYVYKWATMGGVERVLLNRAKAFKAHGSGPLQCVFFLHDSGGMQPFKEYIKRHDLGDYINVVASLNYTEYDAVLSIDTPEVFELLPSKWDRISVECHTHYQDNRQYLKALPAHVRTVSVPSETFYDTIRTEHGSFGGRLIVMRNCLPENEGFDTGFSVPDWGKRPLVNVGRMDKHKNLVELLDGLEIYQKSRGDDFVLVLVGQESDEIRIFEELNRRSLIGRTVRYPVLDFDRVGAFLQSIQRRGAIFVSCSRGESFGLAAAEAISAQMLPLLSNINAHRFLVDHDEDFLYPLGNPDALARQLSELNRNFTTYSSKLPHLKDRFSPAAFLIDWHNFEELFEGRLTS